MSQKISRKDLVNQATILLKGWSDDEIDNAIIEVKSNLKEKALEQRKNGFGKLFDAQQEILKIRGCPEEILQMFNEKRNKVLEKASVMHFFQEHIPFIPIIPRSFMGIYGLMSMVHREEVGTAGGHLDPNETLTDVSVSENLYFIYGIENGSKTIGKAVGVANHSIETTGRLSLTTEEGLSLCIMTNVLDSHSVNCAAVSRRGDSLAVLSIFASAKNKKVVLAWNNVNSERNNDQKFGTPSCAERDGDEKEK